METPALHGYLQSLGRAQHHLHTTIVGLSAVESGIATKPSTLDINWNPNDLIGSAREARRFILQSTLVMAAEKMDTYAKKILAYKGLDASDRYSRIIKLTQIGSISPKFLYLAPILITRWRNRIIHNGEKGLTEAEKDALLAAAADIYEGFKHLEVLRLLQDFQEDRPTLKDVTVLIAMSIQFARQTDSFIAEPVDSSSVKRWLEIEKILETVIRLEKESSRGGAKDPRRRALQFIRTEAPVIATAYDKFGI